jgi:hypothetical protein
MGQLVYELFGAFLESTHDLRLCRNPLCAGGSIRQLSR